MTANAKNLSTLANVLDSGSNGQFLQSTGSGGIVFADVAAGASVYDSAELLPLSGNDAGAMAYVNSTNRFYINNGSGWYSISLVNTNPNITSVQDASAGTTPFTLATDGTATVITITANDPEDVPLTYGYSVTAGSLTNGGGTTATVAQSDNVFTVTPSTTEAYAGTFSLTFTASDGINTATSANGFTLNFITIITDSRYTTLLATATSNKPYSAPSASNQVSSISIGAQTASPTEVVFGDSGTKMFVLSSNRYVYSYSVSTAYDASTASYVATSSELTELSTDTSQSFRFKPDGTVMFVSSSGGYVYQYSLSTAWDVSTISYASKSARHANSTHSYTALTFKPDGTRMYMAGLRYVMSMTLSTPWDLGSTTSDNSGTGFTNAYLNLSWVYGHTITGMDFNSTGTSLTMIYGNNASDKYIIEHPIDSAWNVSNATVLGAAPSIKYQQNSIQGLSYANNGNTLISVLDTGDTVYTYDTSFNGVNNNITDTSSNNHSITVTGDAHAGTFSPYRSGGYSLKFNGTTNNYIRAPYWQRANLGTNDFTVECFVYPTNNFSVICDLLPGSAGLFRLATWTGGNLALDINKQGVGAFDIRTTGGNINYNAWNHVAVCRSGTSLKLYSNGSLIHTETGGDWDYGTGDAYSNIGRWNTTGDVLNGYISNFRVKNSALYTGNTYTVPTEGFTSDAGTTLLVGAGALIDNVTPYGVEMYGVVTSEPFSPYDYVEYSATDHGGSVHYDGSNDDLTITDHSAFDLSTGNWTVEFWWNPKSVNTNEGPMTVGYGSGSTPTGLKFAWENNKLYAFSMDGSTLQTGLYHDATAASLINRWNHVAAVYNGTNTDLYLNGVASGRAQSTNFGENSSDDVRIGSVRRLSSIHYSECSISDVRIVKGTAVYSGNFTPPTGPLTTTGGTYSSTTNVNTSITASNTSLLIKSTDASIIDKSQRANLKLVGNTTGSTTTKFTGAKSMYFDGTGDGIVVPHRDDLNLNSCDWTIEYWFNLPNPGAIRNWTLIQKGDNSTVRPYALSLRIDNSNGVEPRIFPSPNNSSQGQISNNAWQTFNAWHHVAFVRVNSTGVITRYINGTANGTVTSNVATNTEDLYIGTVASAADEEGYIQDLRISKGKAHYTANFTPPTASLEG
jgi:hypothetical protein